MKRILIIILLVTSTYLIIKYGIDLYNVLQPKPMPVELPPKLSIPPGELPPPPPMSMEAGPIKVVIDEATPWESLAKLVSTILVTYLGIKVINKYVK